MKPLLENHSILVKVLNEQPMQVQKESDVIQGIGQIPQLLLLIQAVVNQAKNYDLIYANT